MSTTTTADQKIRDIAARAIAEERDPSPSTSEYRGVYWDLREARDSLARSAAFRLAVLDDVDGARELAQAVELVQDVISRMMARRKRDGRYPS